MPDSPPKRVTRARAKAASDPDTKITKITTASAKISAENKRQAGPAKSTKRKTRTDDEDADSVLEKLTEEPPKKEATKARGRQKKVKDEENKELQTNDDPIQSKTRSTKTPTSEEASAVAPKPRGRPRKAVKATVAVSEEANLTEKTVPAKKNIRRRPPAVVAKPNTAKPIAKVPLINKKVQFLDEKDREKENLHLPAKALKKPANKVTGLKAKPLRKPASARSAARVKAVDEKEKASNVGLTEKPHPLSPKKVMQIAKTSSVSSEDELSGEKTPTRVLCRSPVKPPMSPTREIDKPVSKLNLASTDAPSSSKRIVPSSIFASPARRPPASPFKDAFKESPKRVNLGDSLVNAVSLAPHSPMKTSLLQSPARRFATSPLKFNAPTSPSKSGFAIPVINTATASKQANEFEFPRLLQEKASSPLRASNSPDRSFKVHKINPAEHAAESNLETVNTPAKLGNFEDAGVEKAAPTSPSTQDSPDLTTDAYSTLSVSLSPRTTKSAPGDYENPTPQTHIGKARTGHGLQPFATTLEPTVCVAPAFSFASSTYRSAPEESGSEDELASIHKSNTLTLRASHGIFAKHCARLESEGSESKTNTSTVPGAANPKEAHGSHTQGAGADTSPMTPLMIQMSKWLASSPEKKVNAGENETKRGIFSPAGPTLFDRPLQTPVFGDMESPPKSTFFEDEMAIRGHEDNSIHQQTENQEACMDLGASQTSQTSEEYGDENALPLDPQLQATNSTGNYILTCTPARVFCMQPREIHTVSKVPLRAAGEDSILKVPRKRSRSVGGPLSVVEVPEFFEEVEYSHEVISVSRSLREPGYNSLSIKEQVTPKRPSSDVLQTPGTGIASTLGTPMRTVTKAVVPNVLKGAVVYVDVHTTEGADASGIFVELLTQMGARCVKQWLWNARASTNRSADGETNTSPDSTTPGGKVGITHVVYKDGGKRTLQKVREAKGIVLCVGVGWVLE